jgi:pilus assembly protein CpaB
MIRHRTGLFLMLVGLTLGGVAALLVVNIVNRATEASRNALRQVEVVTSTRNIPDQVMITADALVVKRFPADFAPLGSLASVDQVVGRFANGFIAKDQVVVAAQLLPARRSPNLTDRIPPGRVAVWLPMPDILTGTNALMPGDRVDILLTIPLGGGDAKSGPGALSTQTTLQNIEVFRIGQEEISPTSPEGAPGTPRVQAAPPAPATGVEGGQPGGGQAGQAARAPSSSRAIGFLVDHQDAVTIKFVKDSGGTIDLATRSVEEQQVVRTDAVTMDTVVDRFRFRIPQPVVR